MTDQPFQGFQAGETQLGIQVRNCLNGSAKALGKMLWVKAPAKGRA
jgi:hypothetical protein